MIISKFISICLSLAERKINFDYDRYSDLYTRCLHTFYMYVDVRCRKWWRIKTANRLEIRFNCWWKTVQSSTVSELRQSQALPISSSGFWIDYIRTVQLWIDSYARVCVCVCKQIVSIASLRNAWKLSTILKTKKVRAYWAVCENAIENTSCAKCFRSFDVYRYWLEFGKSVYLLLSWSQSSGARIIDTPNVSVLDSVRTRSKRTSEWTEGNR